MRVISETDVLTLREAAELLRLGSATVRNQAQRGLLPGRSVGRQWRFHRQALLDWLRGDYYLDDEPLTVDDLEEMLEGRRSIERGDSMTLDEYERQRSAADTG